MTTISHKHKIWEELRPVLNRSYAVIDFATANEAEFDIDETIKNFDAFKKFAPNTDLAMLLEAKRLGQQIRKTDAAETHDILCGYLVKKIAEALLAPPVSNAVSWALDAVNRAASLRESDAPISCVNLTGKVSGEVKDFPDRIEVSIVRPAKISLADMAKFYDDRISPALLQASGSREWMSKENTLGFIIYKNSAEKNISAQEKEHGPGANLLLMAVAAEAYRAQTGKNLFQIGEEEVVVRGEAFTLSEDDLRNGLYEGTRFNRIFSSRSGVIASCWEGATPDCVWGGSLAVTAPARGAVSLKKSDRPASVVKLTGKVSGEVKNFPDRNRIEVSIIRPAKMSLADMAQKYEGKIDPFLLEAPGANDTSPEKKTLTFSISKGSIGKTRQEQEKEYGPGANLLLMAIAAEAYREMTGKNLFKIGETAPYFVRGETFTSSPGEVEGVISPGIRISIICSGEYSTDIDRDGENASRHVAWGASIKL